MSNGTSGSTDVIVVCDPATGRVTYSYPPPEAQEWLDAHREQIERWEQEGRRRMRRRFAPSQPVPPTTDAPPTP